MIVVIDNYDSFVYNLVRYLREESTAEIVVMRNTEVDYERIAHARAIVLSPGPGLPHEAGSLMDVIVKYHHLKPMLGVCLGHQALAAFFGGKLVQSHKFMHGKSSLVKAVSHPLFEGMEAEFEVGRYHSWEVSPIEMEVQFHILAKTKEQEIMAIEHRMFPLIGMQFHPESILTPNGRMMIKNWLQHITLERTSTKKHHDILTQ